MLRTHVDFVTVRVMCASLFKLRFIVLVKSTRLSGCVKYVSMYVFRAHLGYVTFCYGMCALCFPASRGLSRRDKLKREERVSFLSFSSVCLVVRDLC